MKKKYEKPIIEFEEVSVATAVASTCSYVVNVGPYIQNSTWDWCSDFEVEEFSTFSMQRSTRTTTQSTVTSFNDPEQQICTCYYTASGMNYAMS